MSPIPKLKEEFESTTNEFKRILGDGEKAYSWLKTVAAFANTLGGTLYVGVEDNGTPVGIPKDLVDKQVQLFLRNVKEHIRPMPLFSFRYLPAEKDLYVIEITIQKSVEPPLILHFHDIPAIYVRAERQNSPASREEIIQMVLSGKESSFDEQKTDIPFDPKDFCRLFERYEQQTGRKLEEKQLHAIGFFTEGGKLKNGSLLFRDDFHSPDNLVKITLWDGIDKGGSVFKSLGEFNGNILDGLQFVLKTIDANMFSYERKTDSGRQKESDYPKRALLEGLVNAYAHRNYFIRGSQIEVTLFRDRLEITSPGGMIGGLLLKKEKDIRSIQPGRRNELICSILSLCRLMEKEGSGFDKIAAEYATMDKKHQPYVSSTPTCVTLVLPNVHYLPGIIDDETKEVAVTCPQWDTLSDKQARILSFCYVKPRTIEEIAAFLSLKVSTYLRKDVLGRLIKANLLLLNDSRRADTYYDNRDIVKLV